MAILPDNDGEVGMNGAKQTRATLELEGVKVTVLDPIILFVIRMPPSASSFASSSRPS